MFRGCEYPDSDDDRYFPHGVQISGLDEEEQDEDVTYRGDESESEEVDEEADEDNVIDLKASSSLLPTGPSLSKKQKQQQQPERPRPVNKFFTLSPDDPTIGKEKTATAAVTKTKTQIAAEKSATPRNSLRNPLVNTLGAAKEGRNGGAPNGRVELPSSTGYQGSARKTDKSALPNRSKTSSSVTTAITPAAAKGVGAATAAAAAAAATTATTATTALKAKKSNQTTVNVFTGGKKPIKRRGIGVDEVDSSRNQKLYDRHSYIRKSELRSRARNDAAPDITKVASALFAPGTNLVHKSQPARQATNTNVQPPENSTPLPKPQPKLPVRSSTAPTASIADSAAAKGLPKSALMKRTNSSSFVDQSRKKTKTVRFTGVYDDDNGSSPIKPRSLRFPGGDERFVGQEAPSPTTGDESLFVDEPMEIDYEETSAATSSAMAEAEEQELHDVSKAVVLTTTPNQKLNVTFHGVPTADPQNMHQPWLTSFLGQDCLHIGHSVRFDDFVSQILPLRANGAQILFSGSMTSESAAQELGSIAGHLKLKSSCLFMAQENFNLLVLPSGCPDFNLGSLGIWGAPLESAVLQYLVFCIAYPIHQLIRPSSDIVERHQLDSVAERTYLFSSILHMRYSPLIAGLPTHPYQQQQRKRVLFFLAFPERALDWCDSVCLWLSVRDPDCKIYVIFEIGAWTAFVERASTEGGVIILHDAIVPFVRRFPKMAPLLSRYNINIWRFSEFLDLPQLQLSAGLTNAPILPPRISRLFPLGKAILITPSFIVTQPQEALKFFQWFFQFFSEKSPKQSFMKLVTAHDIRSYLRDLAGEKIQDEKILSEKVWRKLSPEERAVRRTTAALTEQDLEARQRTWLEVDRWLAQQVEFDGASSEDPPIVFADESIDCNDEQSLVNWFGWWSTARFDQCRRFFVVGSKFTPGKPKKVTSISLLDRATRKVVLPHFSRKSQSRASCYVSKFDTGAQSEGTAGKYCEGLDGTQRFQSQRFNNRVGDLRNFLHALNTHSGPRTRIFGNPVSWTDRAMAELFGDHTKTFDTIDDWWLSFGPWRHPHWSFNTYVGFFYTVLEEPGSKEVPSGTAPRRHPWFAVYRPVHPHESAGSYKHGRTELIIWDLRAAFYLENKPQITMQDLTGMQRALIHHVELYASEKNEGAYLDRVWLGGFEKHVNNCFSRGSGPPIDITAEYLEILGRDIVHTLPGFENYMFANGWREVVEPSPYETTQPQTREDTRPTLQQDTEEIDEEDSKLIFEPPWDSDNPIHGPVSQCTNDFYEATCLARLQDPDAASMFYTYRPTMEWYQNQIAEGRHFEHIMVEDWCKVFKELKVDPGPAGAGADKVVSRPRSAMGSK